MICIVVLLPLLFICNDLRRWFLINAASLLWAIQLSRWIVHMDSWWTWHFSCLALFREWWYPLDSWSWSICSICIFFNRCWPLHLMKLLLLLCTLNKVFSFELVILIVVAFIIYLSFLFCALLLWWNQGCSHLPLFRLLPPSPIWLLTLRALWDHTSPVIFNRGTLRLHLNSWWIIYILLRLLFQ